MGAQVDSTISEGHSRLRCSLQVSWFSKTLGSVDLPRGYMATKSPLEVAGLQLMDFTGNVESDYANSWDNRRSVTGYVNFLAEGPITWQSHTQASIAFFSMEAEYMALMAEVHETDQKRMMFEELGLPVSQPTFMKEDNRGCLLFADYAGNFGRTKHIDFRYHFVRERTQQGNVRADDISTRENFADIFTKALPTKGDVF